MRKPATIERLYLDFDGFFASVMQQVMPELRGQPVGVIPFDIAAANSTAVIACSKEAKLYGVKNVMPVREARALCPHIKLVPQRPDLFRRANCALLNEITCEIPIETVKSIDELTCKLDKADIADPEGLAVRIKQRIKTNIGPYITCSIGFAANRLLAKIACKIDKPNGVTIWQPENMPGPLLQQPLDDIPGVGARMEARLNKAGIITMADLYNTQPKQMQGLWGNVHGERMWYALHGYEIYAQPTQRGMFGHGRVLPPSWRSIPKARDASRLLLTKAARRLRRDGYYANRVHLWLATREGPWGRSYPLPCVNDDHAILSGLEALWDYVRHELRYGPKIMRVGATLLDLSPANARQLDMFLNDDEHRQGWERLTAAIDFLNRKFGKRVVTLGPWNEPDGGYAGGKIAFNRIPSAEDYL